MAYKQKKILKNETAEVFCNDFRNILKVSTSIDDAFDKVDVYQHNRDVAYTEAMELEERENFKAKLALGGIMLGIVAASLIGYYVYINL
ncbi:MAG: hypothetical protein PHC66_01065 [Candidatus Nanoarchaeia archaeon]|nr:hypothetical protein [Candidatus Nanoarchaeia archaeon]MDD5239085.1 hypothetical protein [Candidatus Nanoarchaeia archaeon]